MRLLQMLKALRLLGVRRALGMKRRHERALGTIRGYVTTTCLWALLNTGFWDELLAAGTLRLADCASGRSLDLQVLESVLHYLDGVGIVRLEPATGQVTLTARGRDLLAEPRGMFELLYAYEPVFVELEGLLRGSKTYGRDVVRRTRWVGLGSGRLCRQLPYPVMIDMVRRHNRKNVLDLGCGDGALLLELAARQPDLRGTGIDTDPATVELACEHIAAAGLADRLRAVLLDMFDLPARGDELGPVDCLTACDTFHEYLSEGEERVVGLLADLKAAFPGAVMVVGEFCDQSQDYLRRHPTAFLEHHLFHQLSDQRIVAAERWRDMFRRAGLTIREENIFHILGHGYFVLE